MKELLDQYARYNVWAHKKLLALINGLDNEQQHREIASSFSSLYKTVLHVWGAETIWFMRFNQQPAARIEKDPFNMSMTDLSIGMEQVDEQLMNFTLGKDENVLKEKLAYSNLRGEKFYQPFNQLLMHVFNHGTYHNGQLVTMLRQLKVEEIPSTDFITWAREQL